MAQNNYQCEWAECQSKFTDEQDFFKHVLEDHIRQGNPKSAHCEWRECSRKGLTQARSALVVHVRQHTGEKPYKCSICSAGFMRTDGLNRHMKVHSEDAAGSQNSGKSSPALVKSSSIDELPKDDTARNTKKRKSVDNEEDMSLLKAKLDYLRKEKIKLEQKLQKLEKEAQGYQEQNSALLDQIYDATVPLRTIMADEGKLVKMEKDYTNEVDTALAASEKLVQQGKLSAALDQLTVLEKQTRMGADMVSNSRVLVGIVEFCFKANDWKTLQEQIVVLSKKHGLLKQAVTRMIQKAVEFVEKAPNAQAKVEYIKTLREVTEGKIYVEVERARLTRTLAKIRENEGKTQEAVDVLQELQVETFGSMEKREKTEFIIEQMRLNLLVKDFTRTQIVSRKINTKYFEDEKVQDLKLAFYELMIQHALHENQFLQACKYYREVFNTKSVQEDELKWSEIMRYIVMFIVLSTYDHEQRDLISRIAKEPKLERLPLYKQLIVSFTTSELMRWPRVEEIFKAELSKSFVFSPQTSEGAQRWKVFKDRVIEHNVRVIEGFYSRITFKRMTELLDLGAKETEEFLTRLVTSKTIFARIDRIDGIVVFKKKEDPEDVVNEWTHNVHSLLELVAKTTHLIAKEEMVKKITQVGI